MSTFKKLQQKKDEVLNFIAKLNPMRIGSVCEQYQHTKRKDGTRTKRGPYFMYTRKKEGKTVLASTWPILSKTPVAYPLRDPTTMIAVHCWMKERFRSCSKKCEANCPAVAHVENRDFVRSNIFKKMPLPCATASSAPKGFSLARELSLIHI